MKKITFISFLLLVLVYEGFAQESFSYGIGSELYDYGSSIFESEEYYYIVNLKNSEDRSHGASVIRFSNGNDLIEHEIVKKDTLCRLDYGATTDNGNIILVGRVDVENMHYLYTCIMSEDLVILTEKYFDILPEGYDWFYLFDMSKDENGDIVIVGHMDDHLPTSLYGMMIFRVDQEGNLLDFDYYVSPQWYDSTGESDLLRKADASGYYYFKAQSMNILEFNNALDLVDSSNWLGSYPYSLSKPVTAIYLADGNFGFLDRTSYPNYFYDMRLMIFTPEFEHVMDTVIEKEGRQCPAILKGMDYTDPNQIWVLMHNDMPTYTGVEDYEIFLLDSQLNIIESRVFGGDSDYSFNYLLATNDGGCLVTGSIRQEYGTNLTDIFILKVMPEDILTGMAEVSLPYSKDVLVYPSPFNEKIFTRTDNEGLVFSLYNLKGERLLQSPIRATKTGSINTSGILPGVYIYCIYNEQGTTVQSGKLIK